MYDAFLIGERDGIGIGNVIVPEPFGITQKDRLNHLYCVGKSGSGKSTLLENMMTQDIDAGRGFVFLDPHGDSSLKLLDNIPSHRINDVIYFSPADTSHPIGINLFSRINSSERHIVVEHILSVFRHIWVLEEGEQPLLLNILRHTITALMDQKNATLFSIYRMLIDEDFRESVIDDVSDSLTKLYWETEFSGYDKRQEMNATQSTLTRLGTLLSSPLVRNCIAQEKSRINIQDIADSNKILICNLSKGRVGEQASMFLGAIISIEIYLAAMRRAKTPEEDRTPFFLFVDEFQHFGFSVFENILSESRKYMLGVTISHQYMSQLHQDVHDAILGNVGSIVSFRTGSSDGELFAKEFSESALEIAGHKFSSQNPFEIQAKLLERGIATAPFSGITYPPCYRGYGNAEKIIRHSNSRYGVEKGIVEHRIDRWLHGKHAPKPVFKIDEARAFAKSHGGTCRSTKVVDEQSNLSWECKHNHRWKAPVRNIKEGEWCPSCSERIERSTQELRSIALNRSGEYLGTVHDSRSLWKCKFDHVWAAKAEDVVHGRWCPSCARKHQKGD